MALLQGGLQIRPFRFQLGVVIFILMLEAPQYISTMNFQAGHIDFTESS